MFDEKTTREKLNSIETSLKALESSIAKIEQEIQVLDRKDLSYASEWWKDGKYLYLVYPPDKSGHRKREYIGSEPGRIFEARERIAEYHVRVKLKLIRAGLKDTYREAKYHIDRALSAFSRVQLELPGVGND
jgi:hypothetical protein